MTLFQTLLLFGCVMIGVFFLIDAGIAFWNSTGSPRQQRIKKRLSIDKSRPSLEAGIKKAAGERKDLFIDRYLSTLLLNADSPLTLNRLYVTIAALSITCLLALHIYVSYLPFFLSFVLSLVFGFGIPIAMLRSQISKRCGRFEELLPDAIELIVRSLRIGQPLSTALKIVADEMADPVGKEFGITAQEIAYGKDLPDAVEDMTKRMPLPDLRFFAVAVQIQHESGGNLAEVLEGLSKIIRGRYRLIRKVKALTVEGRFSAWFLSLFPVFMIFVMNLVNPGYYKKVADFAYFNHLVVLTVVLLLINVVAMRIMTRLKV